MGSSLIKTTTEELGRTDFPPRSHHLHSCRGRAFYYRGFRNRTIGLRIDSWYLKARKYLASLNRPNVLGSLGQVFESLSCLHPRRNFRDFS